ncbi:MULTISPECIES: DedA family protein [Pseudoclavibacter]|uniref:DedA family protein n=1 Tax=Pseudoclavibacter TaxID=255204 RepID=UPI0026A8970E|nr:DedA family protein [Pseudoclavibacter sp. RFBA6]
MPGLATALLHAASSGGGAVEEASGGFFGVISDWAIDIMGTIGAPGAGLAVALENLFPPIPSEIILPLAGLAAHQGKFSVVEAIIWTTIGSVVGAYALYWLGRWLGHNRMVWLARKIPLVDAADVVKTTNWFKKHGRKAVFFGRFLPIFRSLISIPAGIERMPALQFGLLTLAGSAIWNTIFVMAGYLLGDAWEQILIYADALKYLVYALVAGAIVWFLVVKIRGRVHRGGHSA